VVKKRDSVALFEVISKTRAKNIEPDMGVPPWMVGGKQAADEQPRKGPGKQPVKPTAKPACATVKPKRGAGKGKEPLVSTAGGRLRLSLDYFTGIVAATGLVLLLAAAFWLGRATAGVARSGQPAQAELGQIASPMAREGPADREPLPARTDGKYYMIIQDLQGGDELKAEALRIADYCTANGEPATVNSYQGRLVVWSLRPFSSPTGPEVLNHARVVEQLGQRYFKKHKTYDFRQRRDGRLEPMMLPYYSPGGTQ